MAFQILVYTSRHRDCSCSIIPAKVVSAWTCRLSRHPLSFWQEEQENIYLLSRCRLASSSNTIYLTWFDLPSWQNKTSKMNSQKRWQDLRKYRPIGTHTPLWPKCVGLVVNYWKWSPQSFVIDRWSIMCALSPFSLKNSLTFTAEIRSRVRCHYC